MKRNLPSSIGFLSTCAFLVLIQTLPAQLAFSSQSGHKPGINNYDVRDVAANVDTEPGKAVSRQNYLARQLNGAAATRSATIRESIRTAVKKLHTQNPNWLVDFNRFQTAPEILGTGTAATFLTPDSLETREKIVRQFLSNRATIFGLTRTQVEALVKSADYANPSGNLSWIELTQKINGIEVFQGQIRAAFTTHGALARLTGNLAPGLESKSLPNQPTLDAANAIAAGAAETGHTVSAGTFQKLSSGKYARGPFVREIEPTLTYFPLAPGVARLAYAMTLWEDVKAYYLLVDAEDGTLLFRKNITNDQSQPATYSVYDNDSPSPLSPTTVLPGTGTQPPLISRSSISVVSELPAFDNLGWITDGGTTTTGNNCDAGLDLVSPDGIEAGTRPVAADRNFTFSYNPAPGSPAPGDTATGAAIRNGIVTNLFFWTNRYHDRLYSLGFTEAAKNFQTSNFSRNPGGGTTNAINGNDAVLAQGQDYSGTNNANFSTPVDGSAPRMQMYLFNFPTPNRDGSLDGEVFLHEMTHGVSNRLHNNGSGLTTTQAGGMGEGWSDYYARCILSTSDENVDAIYSSGGYVTYLLAGLTDNYYYGIRRFPYAVMTNTGTNGKPHNPLTFGDIDPAQIYLGDGAYNPSPIFAAGGADEVHNIGEVWCMTLLEMRARLIHQLGYATGNQRAMQLVTDGMKLDPTNPTIIQARDSIIAADNASNAGVDVQDIRKAFAIRGIGAGASTTGAAVVESYSPDLFLGAISISDTYGNGNGVADPGEDIVITVPLTNPLTSTASSVTATIGTYTASYGNLNASTGSSQSIPYQVPAVTTCGAAVSVPLTFATANGSTTRNLTIPIGLPNMGLSENFDGVVAPALPSGWTTTVAAATSGVNGTAWVTTTANTVDAANNCFSPDLAGNGTAGGEASLVSPVIAISTAASQLSFKHRYTFESSSGLFWDGGVLEIKIGAGSFTDILSAGGTFVQGGYNCSLYYQLSNPLGNHSAWGGASSGVVTTIVNLPASASGQNVQFRWRLGFDDSVGATGWNVDTASVITSRSCTSVDSDGDGLQNGYELANGLNPNSNADAALDADGDGESNLDEYKAGTNPQNPASTLRIIQIVSNNVSGATVTFPSVNGKSYRVEYRNDLTSGTWQTVQNNIPGTGANIPIIDATAPAQTKRFYRVLLL